MTHAAQALIESLDDGICLVDGAGRIQLFNRRFLEILDLASGSLGPGEPVTRLAHLLRARGEYATEAQFQAALGLLGEAVRRAFRIEYARPGGGAVELSAKPVPEGGFLLCVADIAARWKAAEALRRAEGRARQESPAAETVPNAAGEILLAQAIESIAQGFAIFDPKDRLALMNARYREIFEMPPAAGIGRTFEELLRADVARGQYPEAAGGEEEFIRWRLAAHRQSGASFVFLSRQGRWIQARDHHMADGSIVAIRTDVTELVQREEALHESERRFRTLFQSSPLPAWVFDTETLRFLEVNEAAERLYGYSRNEFLAMRITDIRSEDEARRLVAVYRPGEPFLGERRHHTRDGREIDVEVRAAPIEFLGRPAEIVVADEVTRRKQAEERTRQAQRMEAVGQLTGGVAHDFNNLLTVMLGSAELLAERIEAGDALSHGLLANIQTAGRQGADLTQRLLAFARRQPLEPQLLDIHRLIRELEPLLQRTLGDDIETALVLDAPRSSTVVDGHQLQTALLNLALNARDAMPEGGRLRIATADVQIDAAEAERFGEVQPGAFLRIEVSDRGAGMAPDVAARAVEPFFTTKPLGQGTGLGLSMVFGFMKQSGGHMTIDSAPGRGTTVALYLPQTADGTERKPLPQGRLPIATGSERVLYVEDDDIVRRTVVEMLKGLGYRVATAADGPEALRLLEGGEEIDLLFTDVVMPGALGGRELADAALKLRPGLKVLFTSGYNEDAIVHHRRLGTGAILLAKPFRLAELAEKMREVLDGPRGRD